MPSLPLVLASRSPRRADLLDRLGVPFTARASGVDETVERGESPERHVRRLAAAKAAAVARPGELVIGADTTVTLDEAILGTPADAAEARAVLERLAGRTHQVLTAVTVLRTDATPWRRADGLAQAAVTFAPLDRVRLDWYLATGEPFDKAGGYGIQGAGAVLVSSMEGHPSTVVGLPVGLLLGLAEAVDAPLIP